MISRSGKDNFLAAHYDRLAAVIGVLALAGAAAFWFLGGGVEEEIEETRRPIEGRVSADAGVVAADLSCYAQSTNVVKALELSRRVEERYAGFFSSEKRVLCVNEACGLATPEKFDAAKNLVCAFCGATQQVARVEKVVDADGDGLPDAWEKKYGLNPSDPSDAEADADGDDFSNMEEYLAKTDPQNPKDHPDYLDSLKFQPPLKKTYMPFLFLSATKIPNGWRCEFFDPVRKDDYGRKGRTIRCTIDEEVEGSGFVLKSYEKKSAKRAIKGSVNMKEVDVSEVVVERKSDGKKITLVAAENKKSPLTSVDVQATLVYERMGKTKSFDVVPGSEIILSGSKYKVSEIKADGTEAKVTIENVQTGKKRTL